MSAEERLMRYCRIDTQSDPDHDTQTPSSAKQFDLARVLKGELEELGLSGVELDEHCYVYGYLPSNLDHDTYAVGFIAHMDTAPDFTGTNVSPRIIPEFDGNDILLNDEITTRMDDFPYMRTLKGKRLMVTDGNTLLGADDKAGITAIMEALSYLKDHPETPHGKICVGFTPDEEIGGGTKFFDVKKFGADFAYTMDGDSVDGICDETFNAAAAVVEFTGFSIHPGASKNKLINAASIAARFQTMLPEYMTPEHTEGKEGFIHLTGMEGNVEKAKLEYILRDHDEQKLEEKKKLLKNCAAYIKTLYGKDTVKITMKDQYRNMKPVVDQFPLVTELAKEALIQCGVQPVSTPIRGGTDGAMLSYMGLPCPNLGTGGGNFHGRYEYCVIDELEKASEVILKITELVSREVKK